MYLEFVQFLTHRALQVRRSWFQPILGNERQGTRFSPYPRLTEDFPVRKIQGTGNLTVETHANFGELFRDPWGVVHAEFRKSLLSWVVHSWHDRDVDYTEGHDLSCPYGRKSSPTCAGPLKVHA